MEWDIRNDQPIYTQLIQQVTLAILSGTFPCGGRLPPVREMAAEAGVNPNPMQRALAELDRVCRPGGRLIIPTYMNRTERGTTNRVSGAIGKAGAEFKREFTLGSYRQFFTDAGYSDVCYKLCEGRIPCAVAVIRKPRETTETEM